MRRPSDGERECIVKMASAFASEEDRIQLLTDIESATIEVSPDGAILEFHVEGYIRPPYDGQSMFKGKDGFPVDGFVADNDGEETEVLLFGDGNHRLLELELLKPSGRPVLDPQWVTFRLK
jgi:hypothetical protein